MKTDIDKKKFIANCTRQLFDMQNTYGFTPEQLSNRMKGIIEDVSEFDEKIISEAFLEWRRSSATIPTPFDIRKLCLKIIPKKQKFCDFEGTFQEYLEHIKS